MSQSAVQETNRPTRAPLNGVDTPNLFATIGVVGAKAPLAVEYLLYGLASCIIGGVANIAAARGVTLTEVESRVEGDIDLRGILGLSDEVRNGYQRIRVAFTISGDAPAQA